VKRGATQLEEIDRILRDIDLYQFKDTLACNLSGGSRRKLSVAIALIGNSKLVVLDEPTAGMDLSARRRLWNMLKNYKQGRIIILTTHYMDEADILGDRVGIMNEGELVCLGTPLFLKNRFGEGYTLTVIKKAMLSDENQSDSVESYLHGKLGPEVKLTSEISQEVTFQIPSHLATKFQDFFETFDSDLERLGIRSYGISVPTLEDVFLRVTQEKTAQEPEKQPQDHSINDHQTSQLGTGTFLGHLGALFIKRFHISRRNKMGLLLEVFIPAILILIGFGFTKIEFYFDSPERELSPTLLPWSQRMVVNSKLVRTSQNDI